MSLQLGMLALGGRLFVKNLFRVTNNLKRDAARLERLGRLLTVNRPYSLILKRSLGNHYGLWVQARGATADRIILYLHGGGYFSGSPEVYSALMSRLSDYSGYAVFGARYTTAADAPFPAAFEDALAAYLDLIDRGYSPQNIVIGGDSAGGGLTLAVLSEICRRDLPPAAAFALSPWTDLTLSGYSIQVNAGKDPMLPAQRMPQAVEAYVADAPADDPRISPLFAEFHSPPPILFQVGSPEILEDDTYRLASRLQKEGANVEVETWNGAPHGWHLGEFWVPEARQALRRIGTFVQTSFDKASR